MLPSPVEVLFVSHKYPPAVGGMEKQSFELIRGTARYLKVHTIVYDNKEPILLFFFHLNRRIRAKIKANPQIKLIHFNDGLMAALASFHKGYSHLKKVATLHGLDIVFPFGYFQRVIIPRFNTFDLLITVSQATAEAAQLRGIAPSKMTVIPNGVDPPAAQNICHDTPSPEDIPYFITLGRAVKRKGFSWLMQEVIPFMNGNFKLLMVGPFEHNSTWKERIFNLLPAKVQHLLTLFLGYPTDQKDMRTLLKANPERIQHLGKIPADKLQCLLTHAQAFLMPNIRISGDMEGFGLVCLEASTAGTVVVAAELEGITSAITHKKNGILLKSQDATAWIQQLQAIVDSPKEYRDLGKSFQQYTCQQYSWDIMAKAYSQTFRILCGDE